MTGVRNLDGVVRSWTRHIKRVPESLVIFGLAEEKTTCWMPETQSLQRREDASIWQLLWLLLKSSRKGLKRQESKKRQLHLKERHKGNGWPESTNLDSMTIYWLNSTRKKKEATKITSKSHLTLCGCWAESGASDGRTWSNCSLHDAVEENRAGVPLPVPLPIADQPELYHFVGDDAFALQTWVMKPFSHRSQILRERINSYRLYRARRVVENAFGILCQRLRCFLTTMHQRPYTIIVITNCAYVLHNLILIRYPHSNSNVNNEDPDSHDLISDGWRTDWHLQGVLPLTGRHTQKDAKDQQGLSFTLLHLPCWCCPLARKISSSFMSCIHSCSILETKQNDPPPLFLFVWVNGGEFWVKITIYYHQNSKNKNIKEILSIFLLFLWLGSILNYNNLLTWKRQTQSNYLQIFRSLDMI